jgi:hypothetical protein
MFSDQDTKILQKMKKLSSRRKKTFSSVINSKDLNEDDMDELFLTY